MNWLVFLKKKVFELFPDSEITFGELYSMCTEKDVSLAIKDHKVLLQAPLFKLMTR